MTNARTITAENVRKPLRLDSNFNQWSALHGIFQELRGASQHTVPHLQQHLHENVHLPANNALIELPLDALARRVVGLEHLARVRTQSHTGM